MVGHMDLKLAVQGEVWNVIRSYFIPDEYATWGLTENDVLKIAEQSFDCVQGDLLAYVSQDPSLHGRIDVALNITNEIKAIIYYRVGTASYYYDALNFDIRQFLAEKIHNASKSQTQIDIHPAAKIGKRFVLDHAVGTVIGETCHIGNDCYILQGVILGATGIANNPQGKRHPTLGDNVQVGAFVRILGAVTIDDNVIISPYCVITSDIHNSGKPRKKRVLIVNQLQLSRPPVEREIDIYGIVPGEGTRLTVYGNGFKSPNVNFVDSSGCILYEYNTNIVDVTNTHFSFDLTFPDQQKSGNHDISSIRIKITDGQEIVYIIEALGMKRIFQKYTRKDL